MQERCSLVSYKQAHLHFAALGRDLSPIVDKSVPSRLRAMWPHHRSCSEATFCTTWTPSILLWLCAASIPPRISLHPPGYFLYVCLGRLNLLIPDANAALVAISVAASCGAARRGQTDRNQAHAIIRAHVPVPARVRSRRGSDLRPSACMLAGFGSPCLRCRSVRRASTLFTSYRGLSRCCAPD
jgi:hypothetical protein